MAKEIEFYSDKDWNNLYITKEVNHVSQPVNVIRIAVPVRFVWVCASGHDHRWRLGAWLCGLVNDGP
jgi:hypothetical protein